MAKIEYSSVAQFEKEYNFVDAVSESNVINGAWGTITAGKFVPGAGTYAVMQIEYGDNAGKEDYVIPAGEHLRLLDLTKVGSVTGNKLVRLIGTVPAGVAVGDKVKVDGYGVITETNGVYDVTRILNGGIEISLDTGN